MKVKLISCRNAADVDLYTGALSEKPMEGAIIGPLLSCLITDQFLRIKKGDSHWYERPVGHQRFSAGKIDEVSPYEPIFNRNKFRH